jgi:hypothetical protein
MAVDTAVVSQRRDEYSWDQLEEDEYGRLRASVRFACSGWSAAEFSSSETQTQTNTESLVLWNQQTSVKQQIYSCLYII